MTRISLPVLFACVPLGTKLTRKACGMRHREAKVVPTGRGLLVRDQTCARCEIGSAHARGEAPGAWPDGTRLVLASIGAAQPAATRPSTAVAIQRSMKPTQRHAAVAAPVPTHTPKETIAMPHPKPITHNGKTQSLSEWGRELGMSSAAVSGRIFRAKQRGLSEADALADALTKPRDPAQPKTRTRFTPDAKGPMLTGRIRVKGVNAAISKLKRAATTMRGLTPIPAEPILENEPAAALLQSSGFKVLSCTPVPAGLVIVVGVA